jgi:CDP-diacylglycerol--glycerol-3-phosphate 3-phosphatidyltransferase
MGITFDRAKLRKATARWFEQPIARTFMRLKVGPNAVTLFGLVLASVAAYLVAVDELVWAGAVLLISGALDSIDGALARMGGTASPAGALMDSVVDRVSEGVVLLGVLVLALDQDDTTLSTLTYIAFAGSMMVSYVVARAQTLGSPKSVGIMSRPERVVVLSVGLLAGYLTIAVWIIAILAPLTALHRFLYGWNELRKTPMS